MRACRPARVGGYFGRLALIAHFSSSHTSSAFWACSRFSASSHTALCGPSMTSSVISWPRWAGRQCSTTASGSARLSSCGVDLERPERADPVQPVVLLPHRRPGVGDQNVGAVGGRPRVAVSVTVAPVSAARRSAAATNSGSRLETGGGGDGDVDTGGHPAQHQRVRHVVGAVAEVGQPQPVQRALALGERLQIGEHLARVELVGQRVDDRHRRTGCHGASTVPGRRSATRWHRRSGTTPVRCPPGSPRGRAGCCGRRRPRRGRRAGRCPSRRRTGCGWSSSRR